MILVTFPPGAQSPPHTHPVEGMNYIIAGTAESKYEGEVRVQYRTGDTYLDHRAKVHEIFETSAPPPP